MNTNSTRAPLGKPSASDDGLATLRFTDSLGAAAHVSASPLVTHADSEFRTYGRDFLRLGIDCVVPKILARDALALGIESAVDVGLVDYPLPPEVILEADMQLSRDQVIGLVARLQEWIDTGSFRGLPRVSD